ncbi:hypothetical protein HZC30_01670 [Candidatus Woesearchaeota archaeon]|nr:hypothetical protein [Candidatus Woesearchaeota archaeon]
MAEDKQSGKTPTEEKKPVSRIKLKKKNWYKIISPKVFGNKEVGESYLVSADSAIGRKVKINLKDITGNMKDQNNYVVLQVNKASGSQLNTVLVGYELSVSGVKRAIRPSTCRLDDSFTVKTKSGRSVTVKVLLITLNKAQRSKCTMVKKMLRQLVGEEIAKSGFDTFVVNVASQRIQYAARKMLGKIYPLRELAFRVIQLNESGLVQEEIVVEAQPEPTAPESVEEKPASIKEEAETENITS